MVPGMLKIKRLMNMKKIVFLAALIASVLSSCSVEDVPANDNGKEADINKSAIVIGASTEETTDVKSSYTSSWEVSFDSTDQIGLVVSNSSNSWYTNADCSTTQSGTSVSFTSNTSYSDSDKWNVAAFYPWNGTGNSVNNWYSSDNNAYNGVMYFKLPSSYSGYTSGKNYMPMLANLTGDDTHPANMSFKHVGAGVHVKITDLPAGAHSIGMEVDGVQLWGDFASMSASDAGSSSLSGSGNSAPNADQVWLNFTALAADASWDFIFPVPPLTTPTLIFKVYDKNDVCIWSRTATDQKSVGRAKVLDMPQLSIASSLYVVYIKDDSGWSGTRYLYAYDGSGSNLKAWPGLESSGTETISGTTYQKFLLPKSAKDTKYYLIYNNGSSSVNLPDITLTSSAKKNYICTNGTATSVVSTSAPAAAVSKKIIEVGVISYIYNENLSQSLDGVQVHHWGGSSADGDIDVVPTGTTDSKQLGDDYWSNAAQTFYMSRAAIPSDITGFKVRIGDRWFGSDATSSNNKVYIFNYGGDQSINE